LYGSMLRKSFLLQYYGSVSVWINLGRDTKRLTFETNLICEPFAFAI
jgi:hypothetical protein